MTRVFLLENSESEERMAERIAAIDHAVKEVSIANAFLADRSAPSSLVKPYEYSNPYHVCPKTNWPLTAGSALVWNPLAGLQKCFPKTS
jgi:hypothetical protein